MLRIIINPRTYSQKATVVNEFTQQYPKIYYRDEVVVEGERLFSSLSFFFRMIRSLSIPTLFPFSLSFFLFVFCNNCAHLHNSWVSIMVLIHAHTHKRNLHGPSRKERRTCRTISFCMYGASRLLYVCAFDRTFFLCYRINTTL